MKIQNVLIITFLFTILTQLTNDLKSERNHAILLSQKKVYMDCLRRLRDADTGAVSVNRLCLEEATGKVRK